MGPRSVSFPPSSSLTTNPASCDHLSDEATAPSSASPSPLKSSLEIHHPSSTSQGWSAVGKGTTICQFSPISSAISWNKCYNFSKICHGVEYIYYGFDLCKTVYVCLKGYMQLFNLNIKRFSTPKKKENQVQLNNLVWKELCTNCYAGKFLFLTFWLRPKIHRNKIKLFDYFLSSNRITFTCIFPKRIE